MISTKVLESAMRAELEEVLTLYEEMPEAGKRHWRERSLPSIRFENDAEREEFTRALDQIDEG